MNIILSQQGDLMGGQEEATVLDPVAVPHSLADAIREKLLADDDSDQAILGTYTVLSLVCSGCSMMLKCSTLLTFQRGFGNFHHIDMLLCTAN
jgi:hypothetical protein